MPTISGSVGASAALGTDGWTTEGNAATFASATTFTVGTTDLTAQYTPGTRLRLTNTTLKFFVVVSSSFGAGTTTVTVTGGTDFTLANAAITGLSYSYQANPQGYPSSFAYTPTATGFSSALTVNTARFAVAGRTCTWWFDVSGTSNATSFTLLAPIANRTQAGSEALTQIEIIDNGAVPATPGKAVLSSGGASATINKDNSGTNFTAAGSKGAIGCLTYEI